jgi:hypothetical protein
MKPVFQTKFGLGNGNCLQAAVASVLDCELGEVPDFNMSGIGWFEEMTEWAFNEGHGLLWAEAKRWDKHLLLNAWVILIYSVEGYEEHHAVVGKCVLDEIEPTDRHDSKVWHWRADVIHDPNPQKPKRSNVEELLFLLPHTQPRMKPRKLPTIEELEAILAHH